MVGTADLNCHPSHSKRFFGFRIRTNRFFCSPVVPVSELNRKLALGIGTVNGGTSLGYYLAGVETTSLGVLVLDDALFDLRCALRRVALPHLPDVGPTLWKRLIPFNISLFCFLLALKNQHHSDN